MKNLYLAILCLTLVLLTSGCGLEKKTLNEFYDKDFADVSKIVITDGNTGYERTVTDNDR